MVIKIKNLKLKTIIGIYDWEQSTPQEILINVKIETNQKRALESDNISDTIDYDSIVTKIKNLINKTRFRLIEKMIGEMMKILMEDERIRSCELEIEKLMKDKELESCSITLFQQK